MESRLVVNRGPRGRGRGDGLAGGAAQPSAQRRAVRRRRAGRTQRPRRLGGSPQRRGPERVRTLPSALGRKPRGRQHLEAERGDEPGNKREPEPRSGGDGGGWGGQPAREARTWDGKWGQPEL